MRIDSEGDTEIRTGEEIEIHVLETNSHCRFDTTETVKRTN
jgi:hypothetical protein